MSAIRFFAAATLATVFAAAHAATGKDVNLDGSTAVKKPTLAASADSQLRTADVPSVKTDPAGATSVKAQADAEMASRDARTTGPRLQVQRQNLKENQAERAIAQQATPASIDHDTAYGDIEHTEQLANVKISVKK